MTDNHVVDDSQPEDPLDLSLSWEQITKEKERSTRKAKQLDKIHKELQPLNKEYRDIELTRMRNKSFHKNNQFTVVAAEFLNLSSKTELDQLFEDGFSKDEIEDMLEQKYQEKKKFYTEINVKNHKFKRKSFESWRSMSNSHSASTNTFTSEEEFKSQISKPQQLRLKRINNKPLRMFRVLLQETKLKNNVAGKSSTHISSPAERTPKSVFRPRTRSSGQTLTNIPNETGLLEISSETDTDAQNSSLLFIGESFETKTLPVNDKLKSKSPKQYLLLPPGEENTTDLSLVTAMQQAKGSKTGSDAVDRDSQIFNTQAELLEIFSEKKDTTFLSSDQINDEQQGTAIQLPSSPEKAFELPLHDNNAFKENEFNNTGYRRNLRHRTIVNRNPYLVDRAEYLGLSTKYELIFMAEKGKSDDEILEFLDSKYQRRRKERKDKEVGFGPFSKLSFYEIMDGRNQPEVIPEDSNFDSPADSYQIIGNDSVSDQEFELSMDEESDINIEFMETKISDSDTAKTHNSNSKDCANGLRNSVNTSLPKVPPRFNLDEIFTETNHINGEMQTGRRKRKRDAATTSKFFKKKKILEDTVLDGVPTDQTILSTSTLLPAASFNPYSMNLLTLSDEETPSLPEQNTFEREAKSPQKDKPKTGSTVSAKKSNKSVLSSSMEKLNVQTLKIMPSTNMKFPKSTDLSFSNENKGRKKSGVTKIKSLGEATYHPSDHLNYDFNRPVNVGSYQEEVLKPFVLEQGIETVASELNLDFAKNTGFSLVKTQHDVSCNIPDKELTKIIILWKKYDEARDLYTHKYKFLINLKPSDYKTLKAPQSFLKSMLLAKSLSEEENFYRNKAIKLEFLSTKMLFEMPLKAENTLSQIRAFHDILLGSLKGGSLHKFQIKQLRKSLIHLLMILSNIQHDCSSILPQIGMEMNSFLNRYKKNVSNNEIVFCIFAPYFLIYMKMFQKFLPTSSEFSSSFKNTEAWLSKRITRYICNTSFEKIFIHVKSILVESLYVFLKCTSNPWSNVGSLSQSTEVDVLNALNFLYFCNSYHSVEMDWEFFTTALTNYCDKLEKQPTDLLSIKNLFASVLKLNRELSWELEDHLVVKMFRLLAEYKFENIGSMNSDKPTIYPNIPATDALTEEDGCLDIYFKILNIYTKQYLSENTKSLVERLIPIRSTSGYSPAQLQNRAKVLLMMVYTFDQDLGSSLESILNDMIRNGSLYCLKSSFALIRTIIRQTPRRPYNMVRKFLPLLISKINHLQPDRELFSIFKDLVFSVNELLNGQDISHLKRMVDFLGIILKFKLADNDTGFEVVFNKSFLIISQQYEFLKGVEISERDELRLKRSLSEVGQNAKMRLLDENSRSFTINKLYLKFWLYASSKSKQPAIQLLYTEWNYFGSKQLRDKYELTFFTYLAQSFEVSSIKEEVLTIFFKHLAFIFTDLSSFFQNIVRQNLITLRKYDHQNFTTQSFQLKRVEITIKCLSSLFREKDEKLIYHVLQSFIISLKGQLVNFEAKNYIKEVGLYLYTVAGDRYDIPEWDYLVNKLKLETVEGSLSKKIQFVETVEDITLLLEKIYIGSLLANTYNDFKNQFVQLTAAQICRTSLLKSLCSIVSFHAECILRSKNDHWVHLANWMENFCHYTVYQTHKQDLLLVCKVLLILSKLSAVYVSSHSYRYHYLTVLQQLYTLLEWALTMFWGFEDFKLFSKNFWSFAGMDPAVSSERIPSTCLSSIIDNEQGLKVQNLYKNSDSTLQDKFPKTTASEKDIYSLESEMKNRREMLIKKWKLPKNSHLH